MDLDENLNQYSTSDEKSFSNNERVYRFTLKEHEINY